MRLTLVTETFPPEINGVARTLGRWADTFRARGHQVQVIRPRQPREVSDWERVWALPLPFYPEVHVGLVTPQRVGVLYRRGRPDLIHIATEGTLGLSALIAARQGRIPIASSFHTNFDRYLGHYGFGTLERLGVQYLRWFHNRTAVTLVPSETTREQLLKQSFERVEIWSRGVDSEVFHPRHRDPALRQSIGMGDKDVLLLYVGRLAPEKNLEALMSAFARLRERLNRVVRERVQLALVGGGPMTETLKLQSLPGVHLLGYQHGAALSGWYASGDMFVFPSLSETFGNVILEAQASGLPVVGFEDRAVKERVRHAEDGLLVPLGGDLAEPLKRLCLEPDLRQRLAQAARRTAQAQDWKPIFDRLEQRYHDLILQSRSQPSRST
jgi:glycosyltransferase involved in cell wall biosynthesis